MLSQALVQFPKLAQYSSCLLLLLLLATGQIKHFRAGPVGCMWKGIAPYVAPIPHLGIRSWGLKSHLLLTLMHSPTLVQYFSDLLFLSLLLGFFLLSLCMLSVQEAAAYRLQPSRGIFTSTRASCIASSSLTDHGSKTWTIGGVGPTMSGRAAPGGTTTTRGRTAPTALGGPGHGHLLNATPLVRLHWQEPLAAGPHSEDILEEGCQGGWVAGPEAAAVVLVQMPRRVPDIGHDQGLAHLDVADLVEDGLDVR